MPRKVDHLPKMLLRKLVRINLHKMVRRNLRNSSKKLLTVSKK